MSETMPTDWKALLEIVRQRTPDVWRIAGGPENPTHYTISSFHETRGYQIHSMQWIKERWPGMYESMKPTYIKDAAAIVVAVNHFEEAVATAMATEAEIEKRVHERIGHLVEQTAKYGDECRELKRERDQLQRDLDAALTVMANHDLSLGDAITMPLKQEVQIGELTRQRDEMSERCKRSCSPSVGNPSANAPQSPEGTRWKCVGCGAEFPFDSLAVGITHCSKCAEVQVLTRQRDELLDAVRYAERYGEHIGDAWPTKQMQHVMNSVEGKP